MPDSQLKRVRVREGRTTVAKGLLTFDQYMAKVQAVDPQAVDAARRLWKEAGYELCPVPAGKLHIGVARF